MEHNFVKHENCHLTSCAICEGGLGLCKVCGCFEGQLATECPGFDVGSEIGDLIWKGVVDFVKGDWVFKHSYKDWWTIKIFAIALLFLITVMSTPVDAGWGRKLEQGWIEPINAVDYWAPYDAFGNNPADFRAKTTAPLQLYTITFHNNSYNDSIIYCLYHIDHGFPIFRDIMPAAGELAPGKSNYAKQKAGLYHVVWKRPGSGLIVKATESFKLNKNMDFYYP